jgi:hypothetical protein
MRRRRFLSAAAVAVMVLDGNVQATALECFPTLADAQVAYPEVQHFWQRAGCIWIHSRIELIREDTSDPDVAALREETAIARKRARNATQRPVEEHLQPVQTPVPDPPAPPEPVTSIRTDLVGVVRSVPALPVTPDADTFSARFEAVREAHIPQDLAIALGRRAAAVGPRPFHRLW